MLVKEQVGSWKRVWNWKILLQNEKCQPLGNTYLLKKQALRGAQHQKQREKSTLENELVETLDELQQPLSVRQLISLGTEPGHNLFQIN